jgi:hypothetical protein
MSDPLATYLHDHLAGSTFAVELLETLETRYPEHETGRLAATLLAEVREDQSVLQSIISRVGSTGPDLKDASAWLAEKASRTKLKHDDPRGFGAFEAFEALYIGIAGKRLLWEALSVIGRDDGHLADHDFDTLARRAQDQCDRVDRYRLRIATSALLMSHSRP